MGAHGDNVFVIFGFAVGAFLMALLVLFGILGIFLLGFVLIPLLPVVAVVAAIVLAMTRSPVPAAEREDAAAAVALEGAEAPVPVVAAVVDAGGACIMGRAHAVGDAWTLNGRWSREGLCPEAARGLSETAERMRSGVAPDGEIWRCPRIAHRILFQLRLDRREPVASPA